MIHVETEEVMDEARCGTMVRAVALSAGSVRWALLICP